MIHKNICVYVPKMYANVPRVDVRVQNKLDATASLKAVALECVGPKTMKAIGGPPVRKINTKRKCSRLGASCADAARVV